ncbi:MAG TPA: chemotaxis-specific protein-glutamate methyltransferase CheB [Vicinamibacterales bacterium]|jgi:two-component system chemotaxis response regulator CheB
MTDSRAATARMSTIVRVLVVDDSAYVRKMMTQMLTRSPFVEVIGTARDGNEALELAADLDPDVITCDLNMPEMDGVAFVRAQMARRPVPIVIISVASPSGEQVLAALEAGAVDFLQKPTALATDRLLDVADELVAKVKAAAGAQLWRVAAAATNVAAAATAPVMIASRTDILVIGISTGGPQALKALIPRLPLDFPVPVAIVLHMPVGYTELYAQKLNEMSPLRVKEPEEGEVIASGTVYLAPAGRHLSFRRAGANVVAHLDVRPLDTPHRPAVDVLFQSAADVYGSRTLGVVMTGMGADGRDGSAWIKARGGQIITEAEQSCVVYGMPRSVVEAGLSDTSAALESMFEVILDRL